MKHERVAIVGGTGLIGKAVAQLLSQEGWQVRIISRNPEVAQVLLPGMESYANLSPAGLADVQAVINLAGAPLFGKVPTKAYKTLIPSSRIQTTEKLVACCAALPHPPRVLIQGSAVGIYGSDSRNDAAQDESAELGKDFLSQVCRDWEGATKPAHDLGIRVVYLRSGLILDPAGDGLLEALVPPFKFFMGGVIGNKYAWKPWVHIADETGLISHAFQTDISGPLNAVSPEIANNGEFFRALGRTLHRPCWLPVPEWILKPIFREMATAICRGPRIVSSVAPSSGYVFKYPELLSTLDSIYPS